MSHVWIAKNKANAPLVGLYIAQWMLCICLDGMNLFKKNEGHWKEIDYT